MSSQTVALVASKTDAETAKELKAELLAKLDEVCLLLDKAKVAGFEMGFNLGKRWDNKNVVAQLTCAKHF